MCGGNGDEDGGGAEPTSVDTSDVWLFDELSEGDGDGDEAVEPLGTADVWGRLRATKCSWLHNTRRKSSCVPDEVNLQFFLRFPRASWHTARSLSIFPQIK